MPHVATAALNGAATIVQADVETDINSALTYGGAVSEASKRDNARIEASKLEFPFTRCVAGYYVGHRTKIGEHCGHGREIVIMGPDAPDLTLSSGAMPARAQETTWRSRNFIDTIDYFPVPLWTHADAVTPKCRLETLAVTVTVIIHDESLRDSTAKQFSTDQDIADALIVRVYRVPAPRLRGYTPPFIDPAAGLLTRDLWQGDPEVDLSRIAEKTGMTARPRRIAYADNVPIAGYLTGSDAAGPTAPAAGSVNYAFPSFQCCALLDGAEIVQTHTLAPDDMIVVAVTGTDRLIFGGNAVYDGAERTIILPVRGYWVVPVFSDVEFGV